MKSQKKPSEHITQRQAVVEALRILGGRAQLKWIKLVAKHIPGSDWSQAQQPDQNIQREVRHNPEIRVIDTGLYELLSYQTDLTKRDAEIAQLRAELAESKKREEELKELLTTAIEPDTCYEKLADKLMAKMSACDKEDRKDVRDALTKIQNWLVLQPRLDIAEAINNFVYGKQKPYTPVSSSKITTLRGKYPFVCKPEYEDVIIARIKSYMQGKTSPKDIMMPVRAAQDAGVIRRMTFDEMLAAFPDSCPGKTSVSDYTNPDKTPFFGEAFENMVDEFRALES